MTEHFISADENGNLIFIYNDDVAEALSGLGAISTTRASHVEPGSDGKWHADMSPVNGPALGPFDRRQTALDTEVEWLQENAL